MVKIFQSILIILAVALVGFIIYKVDTGSFVIITTLFEILGLFVALKLVFNDGRETPNKIAWIVAIFMMPLIGITMYLFFGRDPRSRVFTHEQKTEVTNLMNSLLYHQKDYDERLLETETLAKRIEKLSKMKCFEGNAVTVLKNGEEKFPRLLEELDKATDHIHMQYYIYNNDELGLKVRDKLIEKAKQGVKVRFLYDGWGSSKLKSHFLIPMHEAGIETLVYDSILSPWIVRTANLRNHRKIVVIDGEKAFTGGLNVGNEYISKTDDFKKWRDTHILVEGPAVMELQTSFLCDWVFALNEDGASKEFITHDGIIRYFLPNRCAGNDRAQVIWGGPYDQENIVRNGMLNLISSAKRSIYITSPYFVPDEASLSVVRRAALSGIDVKLIIPGKGDSPISFNATNYYRKKLLRAGVQVFNYDDESFIHNKVIIVDGECAAIGTANFDIRSFQLNHELMTFLYDGSEAVQKLERDFLNDCQASTQYTWEMEQKKSKLTHAKQALFRMFSPIL